jgi:type I restriction enzyme S subunit
LKTVPLGEVVEVIGGGTPSKRNPAFYGGDIPWATVRDMNVEHISKTEHAITPAGLKASSSKLIPAGEVVIATRVGLGKACILGQDTAINQDLRGLVPNSSKQIDRRFLYHWFKSIADQVKDAGTGATVQGVKLPFIKGLPFPLLSLEEQQRIVAVLDEAFEGLARAREHAEANLRNARELFESVHDDAFKRLIGEVTQKKLDEMITISHGFAFKGADFGVSNDPALPIILTPGNYTEDACLNFSEKNTKRYTGIIPPDFLFASGDLTVVMTDLSSKMKILGKPAFIEDEAILHNQRIGRVRFKSTELDSRLLFHFLRTRLAQKPIRDTATGTMVRHTAPRRILNLEMRFPTSLSEQDRVVAQIDEVEAETIVLRNRYLKTAKDIDDLRQSLLQKAFAGELT